MIKYMETHIGTGAPTPGGRPPDAAPPSEPPKGNFSVEVQQPELLFKLALASAPAKIFSTKIGEADIPNDPLFSSISPNLPAQDTELRHYEDPRNPGHYTYLFSTSLRLSNPRLKINNGHVSMDEIGKITKALETKGYQTEFRKGLSSPPFLKTIVWEI